MLSYVLIVFIEFLVIIVLVLTIIASGKERYEMKKHMNALLKESNLKLSEQIKQNEDLLKYANIIRLSLSQKMYRKRFKKNAIVKEVCSRFYEDLVSKCKQPLN